jgi:hypothetical protein
MKIVTRLWFLVLLTPSMSIGQQLVYDTSDKQYAGIDFKFKDDLGFWTFKFQKKRATKKDPSVGHIAFWRTKGFDDVTDKEFHSAWSPGISFEIFLLKDSIKARELSAGIASLSLCEIPQIGGDWFILGNFIFVNGESCVMCYRKSNKTEYCRPTINYIFSLLRVSNDTSMKEIVNQLPIKVSDD